MRLPSGDKVLHRTGTSSRRAPLCVAMGVEEGGIIYEVSAEEGSLALGRSEQCPGKKCK